MNNNRLNGSIESVFRLLSPLSHIGSSIGPDSYLSTQTIIGANGEPTEVFVYSGNALRGVWRDCGAKYMVDFIGGKDSRVQLPLDMFYLLFSGGSIGGPQSVDIDKARRLRQLVPHISVFGGAVGNMIMSGKIDVGEALPVCRELKHIIPDWLQDGDLMSWRQQTTEISYTRKDDAKDELKRQYLQPSPEELELLAGPQQMYPPGGEEKKAKKSKKDDEGSPQQMRYTIEALCRGTVLWQETSFRDMTDIELGALVAAISEWAKRPVLGGQSRIGMGKVDVDMTIRFGGEEKVPFIQISGGRLKLAEPAENAKAVYDEFLGKYTQYLDEKGPLMIAALSEVVG